MEEAEFTLRKPTDRKLFLQPSCEHSIQEYFKEEDMRRDSSIEQLTFGRESKPKKSMLRVSIDSENLRSEADVASSIGVRSSMHVPKTEAVQRSPMMVQ